MDPPALNIDWTQLLVGIMTLVASGFGLMWKQAVSESKRKDQVIDKLTDQLIRTADGNIRIANAQMELVSLHEKRERTRT